MPRGISRAIWLSGRIQWLSTAIIWHPTVGCHNTPGGSPPGVFYYELLPSLLFISAHSFLHRSSLSAFSELDLILLFSSSAYDVSGKPGIKCPCLYYDISSTNTNTAYLNKDQLHIPLLHSESNVSTIVQLLCLVSHVHRALHLQSHQEIKKYLPV